MLKTEKILLLTIKKHWFNEILSGRKIEEYRQIKKYYIKKFTNIHYDKIILRAGYSKDASKLIADIENIIIAKRKFGLFEFEVFVIKIKNAKLVRT